MGPILPGRTPPRHPSSRVGNVTRRSGAPATRLATVQLGRGVGHLGAVCLLVERPVLVDALLLGVLAVQGLTHLGLEVVVGTVRFRHRSSSGRSAHLVTSTLRRSTGYRSRGRSAELVLLE